VAGLIIGCPRVVEINARAGQRPGAVAGICACSTSPTGELREALQAVSAPSRIGGAVDIRSGPSFGHGQSPSTYNLEINRSNSQADIDAQPRVDRCIEPGSRSKTFTLRLGLMKRSLPSPPR